MFLVKKLSSKYFYIYSLLYDIPAIFSHFQIKVNTPML